jgi:hypothetical protein
MKNFYIKNKINKILLFLVFFIFIFLPNQCRAVKVNLESGFSEINLNSQFIVDLMLNTEKNEVINAVEGVVSFDSNLIELEEIRDGNSIINFWIERPENNNNQIAFAGIIPGGYNSLPGSIFSLVFRANDVGAGTITMNDFRALLHDGLGSEVAANKLNISNFSFSIVADDSSPAQIDKIYDKLPPEIFSPVISQDINIFDNKFILVFATQDKGSGIDYYLVKESPSFILSSFYKWKKADSPYILQDQSLLSYIYVKAVDRNGNFRSTFLAPKNKIIFYKSYDFWLPVALSFVFLWFYIFLLKKIKFF